MCAHAPALTHVCAQNHTCAHRCTLVHACVQIHTCAHARTRIHMKPRLRIQCVHEHSQCTHTHVHTRTLTHTRRHENGRIHIQDVEGILHNPGSQGSAREGHFLWGPVGEGASDPSGRHSLGRARVPGRPAENQRLSKQQEALGSNRLILQQKLSPEKVVGPAPAIKPGPEPNSQSPALIQVCALRPAPQPCPASSMPTHLQRGNRGLSTPSSLQDRPCLRYS